VTSAVLAVRAAPYHQLPAEVAFHRRVSVEEEKVEGDKAWVPGLPGGGAARMGGGSRRTPGAVAAMTVDKMKRCRSRTGISRYEFRARDNHTNPFF
jgi:hypothetical protein